MIDKAAVWMLIGSFIIFGALWPKLLRPYGLTYLAMVGVGLMIGLFRRLWHRRRKRQH
jgi:hypothetical protein